ncbi:hypothetical protein NPIL_317501 [Nephila pilipes]|uniref:Uncharacterized protein n=1 Tax=Nephila pilipes TaxID=299642 RepID=A0A8X6MLJ8_NEPPI|nr:hypothetical protein NPIL_317501 [Nephila pilipes]
MFAVSGQARWICQPWYKHKGLRNTKQKFYLCFKPFFAAVKYKRFAVSQLCFRNVATVGVRSFRFSAASVRVLVTCSVRSTFHVAAFRTEGYVLNRFR